jgi:hypothetical protein
VRSRRRSNITPPDPIFFVDRNLGADILPNALRQAGFRLVVHDEHFGKRQDVFDPEVIKECGVHNWFLLTGDGDLTRRWVKEIAAADIGVFCQTNNHHGPQLWIPRICRLQADIIKLAQYQKRPFVAFITAETKSQLLLKADSFPFVLKG